MHIEPKEKNWSKTKKNKRLSKVVKFCVKLATSNCITNNKKNKDMEIKKSPKADLENKRSMFVLIGLVLALGFSYICVEWTQTEVKALEGFVEAPVNEGEEEIIPQTTQEPEIIQPQTPPPAQVVEQVLKIVDNDVQTDNTLAMDNPDDDKPVEIQQVQTIEDEPEAEDEIFTIVEKQAAFPGGMSKLMEFLKKELQYPQVAIDNNIQGRVMVSFVVNKDGSIEQVAVARGVDPVLDQEAVRVVKKMPKWAPAEQRGKPCRSRFTLPVLFKFK